MIRHRIGRIVVGVRRFRLPLMTFVAFAVLSAVLFRQRVWPPPRPATAGFAVRPSLVPSAEYPPAFLADLDAPLPKDFSTGPTLESARRAMEATKRNVWVNYAAIERAGVTRETPVRVNLAGLPLGVAVDRLLNDLGAREPLAYTYADGVLTISTAADFGNDVRTRVYDVRDMASTKAEFTALAADLTARVAPGTWRPTGQAGSIRILSGQLIVTQTAYAHAQLSDRLEAMRYRNRLKDVAIRAAVLTGPPTALAALFAMFRGRRFRSGHCRQCGYDMRLTPDMCPECGTPALTV